MKRNLELVRLLLLEVEKADAPINGFDLAGNPYSLNEIGYHVEMLAAQGLLDAKVERTWGGAYINVVINGLTWDGCDYLDAIRNDRVWSKVVHAISSTVGTTTLSVVKQIAEKVAIATIQNAL